MTRKTLLKSATLSLLLGALAMPQIASAAAPEQRGTAYNHRGDDDAKFDERQDRREDRFESRQDRREDRNDRRQEVRKSKYKYGYGQYQGSARYHHYRTGDRIGSGLTGYRNQINNPRRIGLPHVGRNMSYIRLHDDVLLINMRSGKVVKVYRNYLRY